MPKSAATVKASGESSKIYMQDLALADCPTTVTTTYDKRDKKDYQVVKIGNVCWMVQNLRFTGTSLDIMTSNVGANINLTYYALGPDGDSSRCTSTNGYNNACIKDAGDSAIGAWYNFAAASAMYVTGSSNNSSPSYDICPKNWHLPTGPYSTRGTDGYSVFQYPIHQDWYGSNTGTPLRLYFETAGGFYDGSSGLRYDASVSGYW